MKTYWVFGFEELPRTTWRTPPQAVACRTHGDTPTVVKAGQIEVTREGALLLWSDDGTRVIGAFHSNEWWHVIEQQEEETEKEVA